MARRSIGSAIAATFRQRCPRCEQGRIYRGFISMNERCPVCNLKFEREPGYFTGAMYASYALGIILTLPVWIPLLVLGASVWVITAATAVEIAILFPYLFRYSRVLWMQLDHSFDPPVTAGDPAAHG